MAIPPLARRMLRVEPNAIGELLKQGSDPSLISFAGGYPDAASFPARELNEMFERAILQHGKTALQYTVAEGPRLFREQIAARMAGRNLAASAENILVLQGSQQGLDLVGKLLIDPGDVIITESPTFLGALIAFNPCEPRYVGIRMDDSGMDMNHLERVLKTTARVKMIYTIPDFQNPTGVTLMADRRKRLIELANQYNVMVVEDTAYRELRYSGLDQPTLKSFDTEDRVIMLGSFSKILAPGLRLGFAVASPQVIEKLTLLKLAADTQCSTLNMAATSLFLGHHDLDAHVLKLREIYKRRRDLMLDTLRQEFPQSVRFTEPDGGLFTWVTFPEGFDSEAFMRTHALPLAKVAYVPGASFFPDRQEPHHARFNYSGQTDEKIVEGISKLGHILKSVLQ